MKYGAFGIALTASIFGCVSNSHSAEVVFVDSYHAEYPWSAGITEGIRDRLTETGHNLTVIRLDTKRKKSEDYMKKISSQARATIEAKNADVVIACDDNAAKFLIVPYLKDKDIPVVFCGLNWDASVYGFPAPNVTGMVEVASADELVSMLLPAAKGKKIGFISADTGTERKNFENIKKKFGNELDFKDVVYSSNFQDFKRDFKAIQNRSDLLIFANNAGIEGWNDEDAKAFLEKNTKIPTGSMLTFMSDYVSLVFGKVAQEQGYWAAATAVEILNGKKASDIPIVTNKEGYLILNARIAERGAENLPPELVEIAQEIIE